MGLDLLGQHVRNRQRRAGIPPAHASQDSEAHIVNTVSMAGLRLNEVIPLGVYSASKHAAFAYSESLRDDWRPRASAFPPCPGGVDTLIAKPAGIAQTSSAAAQRAPHEASAQARCPSRWTPRMSPASWSRSQSQPLVNLSHPELRSHVERRYQRIMDDFDFFANSLVRHCCACRGNLARCKTTLEPRNTTKRARSNEHGTHSTQATSSPTPKWSKFPRASSPTSSTTAPGV